MKKLRVIIIVLAACLFFGILRLHTPDGLTAEGQKSLAIFSLCLVLWVTDAIPLAATSLLALVLLPLVGAMGEREAFSLFGNQAVFFILGAFMLAAALLSTGLSTRLALIFISMFKSTPKSLLGGVLISSAFLSFWMPEHAVAALMFPIILEIAKSLKLEPGNNSNYGKALFLSLAWGSIIGGVATFLGGARNPLAIGMLKETYGLSIGFFEWMVAVIPMVVIMLFVAFITIQFFLKIDIKEVANASDVLKTRIAELGRMTRSERMLSVLMLATICAWIFMGQFSGLATISVLAGISIFVFGIVTWKDIEGYVNWGVILMYGGAIALASALYKTGAAEWLAYSVFSKFTFSPYVLLLSIIFIALILTECISNTAVVALLLPIAFSLGKSYGINPIIMVYAVAVPSGLAFTLPMGTPPNAICYAAGYYKLRDIVSAGLFMNLAALIIFALVMKFYWPLVGIKF
ncbi:MAG: anion transporter [Candidatus Omnitrophica bacterium CG1_02_49_10]|nr:MAG: anion transporter [Candidatus Omnitrophica bacterium CG1_02_49_10]